jgi:nucleoside-diphosphate-sugar epimerase
MRVLIIGAAGLIGVKLTRRLIADGAVAGKAISALSLADVIAPAAPAGTAFAIETHAVDLSAQGAAESLIASRPNVIFHLAAIVSGEAEADFEKGYRVNLDGTRYLLEAIRRMADGYQPRVIFTSSIAVYGAPLPSVIDDDFALTPLTSYGTQKAIDELLLADYSRRGFIDGIGLRLPTICVRPGKPNRAASGFFSSIIREPLNGQSAILPVPETIRHWFASPRAAIGFLIHAAGLDTTALGARRSITLPGMSATVAEQIAALRDVAGERAAALIERRADETIARIIGGWPQSFTARRALALGFRADRDFAEIVQIYIDDELGGRSTM